MVSAIITTHNRKRLLKSAIDSVLSQTYPQIECIVVDDAGTDGTKEFIRGYIETKKIQYIYIPKEESKGGNHARNVGILASHGEYIAFLDDDDEWLPEKIEKQAAVLEENLSIGFVYCGVIIERNMDKTARYAVSIDNQRYKDGDISKEVLIRILTTTTTMMVRRSVIDEAGLFDEKLNFWQEYEFSIRILQKTNAKCIRENLVIYRVVDGDKHRLSNRIQGWEDSVRYIEEKHRALIGKLSEDENALRQVYVCIDGFSRGKRAGSYKTMIKYAWKVVSNPKYRKIAINKYRNRQKNGIDTKSSR